MAAGDRVSRDSGGDCTVFRDTRPWDKSAETSWRLGFHILAGLQPFRGGVLRQCALPEGHTQKSDALAAALTPEGCRSPEL